MNASRPILLRREIAIGSELGVPDMRTLALITASYASVDCTTGLLGIIGPTRLEYERSISIVVILAASSRDDQRLKLFRYNLHMEENDKYELQFRQWSEVPSANFRP